MYRYLLLVTAIASFPLQAAVIDVLQAQAERLSSMSGTFQQTRKIAVLPLPLLSNGQFSYHRDEGLQWETLNPVKTTLKLTNDNQNTDTKSAQFDFISEIILGVFSGNVNTLEEQFSISEEEKKSGWALLLTPKNKALANHLQKILLHGHEFTEQVIIVETNGDITDITFDIKKFVELPR